MPRRIGIILYFMVTKEFIDICQAIAEHYTVDDNAVWYQDLSNYAMCAPFGN